VFFRAFQSENISGEIKASNLPTSLSEHLAGANGAIDDLVYVVGRIVIANDFAFASIRFYNAEMLKEWIGRLRLNTHYVPLLQFGQYEIAFSTSKATNTAVMASPKI
jgi:hypothetical protein